MTHFCKNIIVNTKVERFRWHGAQGYQVVKKILWYGSATKVRSNAFVILPNAFWTVVRIKK